MKTLLVLVLSGCAGWAANITNLYVGQQLYVGMPLTTVASADGVSDVTDNLVGWWKLNDATGTNAADSSGLSHNGSLYGSPSWSTWKTGAGSLYFAANTDYVEVPSFTNLNGTNITVCAWVNYTNIAANSWPRVIDRVYNGQFAMYVVSTAGDTFGRIGFPITTDDGSQDWAGAASGVIVSNTWVHIAMSWDQTNITCYTNGNKTYAYNATPTGPLKSSTSVIRIGQRADAGGNRGWTGWLADIRVYCRTLSDAEVTTVYNATKP